MRIAIDDAHALLNRVMAKLGFAARDIPSIVDHLIDCELRGVSYGGLARAVSITERIAHTGQPSRPIAVTHETPVSARIDGADHVGYIVGQRATDMAIEKANAMGLSAVGAVDTWYTGMLSYFAEQAAAHDLVTMRQGRPNAAFSVMVKGIRGPVNRYEPATYGRVERPCIRFRQGCRSLASGRGNCPAGLRLVRSR